jgi:hypothetical protein
VSPVTVKLVAAGAGTRGVDPKRLARFVETNSAISEALVGGRVKSMRSAFGPAATLSMPA